MSPTIPVSPDGQESEEMATVPQNIDEQNIARIAAAGAQSHENFVQFGHILDLAYEADRKMVSLVESLGVRESTSRAGHLGLPIAGAGAAE